MRPRGKARKSGFTLVEVALAILVLAIGLLVVMGLFPSGLNANKVSMDETYASFFADEVLNGVKARSKLVPWAQFGTMSIAAPATNLWQNPPSLAVTFGNTVSTNVYRYNAGNIVAYALRYRLTYTEPAADRKRVKLEVWNGEFGPTTDPLVFFTEIFYPGT